MEGRYLANPPALVKRTFATDGSYQVTLPPGTYSLFVEDDGREYCDRYNGTTGMRCQVDILPGQVTRYNSRVNHASW